MKEFKVTRWLQRLIRRTGIAVVSSKQLKMLEDFRKENSERRFAFLDSIPRSQAHAILDLLKFSKSQLSQDLFVLAKLDFKRNGYFVEFGASNGVNLSNTFLLESQFGWTGILAEPARIWHESLTENRPGSRIDKRCVWSESGEVLKFSEAKEAELSTLERFVGNDGHSRARRKSFSYEVTTISLKDLLAAHNAPKHIDYLSIDTEGSEHQILEKFDFSDYVFGCITVEHNFTAQRELIYALLTSKGYIRVFENLSEFDDWYVASSLM